MRTVSAPARAGARAPGTAGATRRVLPAMRVLLGVFSALTALAVVALFVLAEQTDETFAWTIQPPLTAAFLGAGYAAGCVLVVLSLRRSAWADVRVPVGTVLVFVVLTLAATLLHLDRFHLDPDTSGAVAVAAGWFWLAVYVTVPVGMVATLWPQERAPGADPPARAPLPRVLRVALAAESVVLTAVGAALFAAPGTATALWPWPLTPLTARVVAAWLVAFGLATALAAVAGDLQRLRTAAVAYTVFGVLVAVAVARFADTVAWGDPAAWVFAAATVAVVATGATGWRLAAAHGDGR
ncbi:hypothetical protein [Blastococcus sp. SYSU D00813]